MIMKLNVSNELKSRLMHAAENGSVIAKDILLEVKKNVPVEEIIRGTYNCFSTKRKRTEAGTFKKIRIVFTACSKDLAHPSFPDSGILIIHCGRPDGRNITLVLKVRRLIRLWAMPFFLRKDRYWKSVLMKNWYLCFPALWKWQKRIKYLPSNTFPESYFT